MKRIVLLVLFVSCLGLFLTVPVIAAESTQQETAGAETLLNLNDAAAVDLTTLPGVGKVIAERIVVYRNENGPFKSVDDLVLIKGIGKKVFAKIRPLVTI